MPDELKGVFWDMDRDWIIHVYDDGMFIYTLDEKMMRRWINEIYQIDIWDNTRDFD